MKYQQQINKFEEFKESEMLKKQSVSSANNFQENDYEDLDSASLIYSKQFEYQLMKLEGINENKTFLELVQKEEITNVI